jgi:DNA helicase-2/ATP-dependent DNA helicase PcrA
LKFNDLTDEQQKFARTQNKHIIALASAGAGKTQTLIFFIYDKISFGVKPNEIISFSFTRKAANELKERVNKFFEKDNFDFKYISTIHSFCWNEMIKPFYKEVGYTNIPTITHEFPEEFMDQEFKTHGKKMEKGAFNKKFMQTVSKDLQREDFQEPETVRLLQYLVEHNLVMFDFMIHLANFILEEPEYEDKVLAAIGPIKYIITDEAQDLNPAQYKFTKLLNKMFTTDEYEANLVKVGDFKQSIYGFRGSDPKIINQFTEEFDPSVEIMSYNFRSAPEIVELANDIAETIDLGNDELNKSRESKAGSNIEEGDVYNIYDVEEFLDELKVIETPLHETCILARTNQAIKQLAKVLGKLNIPYYLHTEYDILKRAEVKLLMNMLSVVSHGYNKSIMIDMIKAIKGGVPMKVASSISKCDSVAMVERMFRDIKKIPELCDAYHDLEKGQFNFAIPKIAKMMEGPKKPAEAIEQSLNRFYRDLNEVKTREGLSSWIEALEEMLFEAQFLEEKAQGKVQLMTVHKAKGLQWNNVIFIYDFSLLEQVENDFYDLEEEKRVVYTAVTRPKENLCIWDLPNSDMSELFYKGKMEKMIDNGIRKGFLDLDDFAKY